MQYERRLTRAGDFASVFRGGKSWSNELLVLFALSNSRPITRFGFSVSKRVGRAVVRNRVKRRLRELARAAGVQEGWDLVFISRNRAASATFQELRKAVTDILKRGKLAGEEVHSTSIRTGS